MHLIHYSVLFYNSFLFNSLLLKSRYNTLWLFARVVFNVWVLVRFLFSKNKHKNLLFSRIKKCFAAQLLKIKAALLRGLATIHWYAAPWNEANSSLLKENSTLLHRDSLTPRYNSLENIDDSFRNGSNSTLPNNNSMLLYRDSLTPKHDSLENIDDSGWN